MAFINKKTVTAFILGIIVALFVVHAYTVYQVRDITLQNQAAIAQIIDFINQTSAGTEVQAQ